MSNEKISEIFMRRIDNTDDIDAFQEELLVMQRIKRDTTDEDVKEEIELKIEYVKRRLAKLCAKCEMFDSKDLYP